MRLIILAIVVYVAYRVLRSILRSMKDKPDTVKGEVVEELVQDPYCKLYVPRRDSVKRVVGGRTYYFCSEECARRFELEGGNREKEERSA